MAYNLDNIKEDIDEQKKPDIEEILKLLKDEYERAKELKFEKPIAYALYQIWRYSEKESI